MVPSFSGRMLGDVRPSGRGVGVVEDQLGGGDAIGFFGVIMIVEHTFTRHMYVLYRTYNRSVNLCIDVLT